MKTVGPKDIYQVNRMSLISDLDWGYAVDFYLPLLGPIPFAVYRLLYEDPSALGGDLNIHENLFRKSQISSGEFYHAMECLEALALVKTYVNDVDNVNFFLYAVYAPKNPKAFLKDVLLTGTLRKYIGDEAIKKLREKYKAPKILPILKDVSVNFSDVYHPDYSDPVYGVVPAGNDVVGGEISVNSDFNLPSFLNTAAKYGVHEDGLSPDEKATIAKYGTLYSISPKSMAEIVSHAYAPTALFGKRVDFARVEQESLDTMQFPYLKGEKQESEVSGESALANKIRMMDKLSPVRFLSYLQNGTKPVAADAAIATHLSQDVGLANGPANALIEYALNSNDNVLSAKFCDKLAAGLRREGVKTARDAMDYLNRLRKKRNGTKKNAEYAKTAYTLDKNSATIKETPKEEEEPLEDLDTLLAEFYHKK